MATEKRRFRVGLSFPGEHRDKISRVAELLAEKINREKVFYDEFWTHEIAGLGDADLRLQEIYQNDCDLVAVFFGKDYENKAWCSNIEWPAIRNILKTRTRENTDVLPFRLDYEEVRGLFSTDICVNATSRDAEEIANLILRRLDLIDGQSVSEPNIALSPALKNLEAAVQKGEEDLSIPEVDLNTVLQTPSQSLKAYRLTRIAEWARPRFALDKRFTSLSLLLDQGEEAQGQRFTEQKKKLKDLREVFTQQPQSLVFVLLGAPGSGKSTLLRRFELDNAVTAIISHDENAALSFFISLKDYRALEGSNEPPAPLEWLNQQWSKRNPQLPALNTLLNKGRVTLLLDALNEMPHRDFEHFGKLVDGWKTFLQQTQHDYPDCRVIFSCRTLDYSATLSTEELTVPHIQINPFTPEKIKEFLERHATRGEESLYDAAKLFAEIKRTKQLDLYSTPYYLKLLSEQAQQTGKVPSGRAGLFTAFVRATLRREYLRENQAVLHSNLLHQRDIQRLPILMSSSHNWPDPYELPDYGPLFTDLANLAFQMQDRAFEGEASQITLRYRNALSLLDPGRAEALITAGSELGILDHDRCQDTVQFVHQLLQEYFAARAFALNPEPAKVASPWLVKSAKPSLEQTLKQIADYEPLPSPATSGWEETVKMAIEMAEQPERLIQAIAEVNLPLSAQAVVRGKLELSETLRETLEQSLLNRCEDQHTDIRHRIAAGLALGDFGDPRFALKQGKHGRFIPPKTIRISDGSYMIGSDTHHDDESPRHPVKLKAFKLGKYPVTNAEWQCFMDADGYDDERWWHTEAAKAWRAGESTADGPKKEWREHRVALQKHDEFRSLVAAGQITSQQADDWEQIARMSDEAFEAQLDSWYPSGRQTEPSEWRNARFNNPLQPIVGICWHEARAYCAWLQAQTGKHWRLPTEVEWEAAASGKTNTQFAYGQDFDREKCNAFPTHIRETTAAGIFPLGDTHNGLVDMTGNVVEWTSSCWQDYPYDSEDGREDAELEEVSRVLRGGSWLDTPVYCRSAYRRRHNPDLRSDFMGFRLCCSSPIE